MQKMGFDTTGRERRVVSLQEDHAHDIVTDVPLALKL